jgi:TonB family protein
LRKTIRRALLLAGCLLAIVCLAAQIPDANKTAAREALNGGIAAFNSGNPRLAADSFIRALELDPDLTAAELYLGATYASMAMSSAQNTEINRKAIQSFERLLQKEPGNQEAATRLASVYASIGETEKARALFRQVSKASPQDPTAFFALGAISWVLAADKKNPLPEADRRVVIDEGLQSLDVALTLNPQYVDAMAYRNLLLRQKAEITTDAAEKTRLVGEADTWFARAVAARAQNPNGIAAGVGPGAAAPPPPLTLPPPQSVRIGPGLTQTGLVRRVEPVYPQAARAARVQGVVLLRAVINKSGQPVDLSVISGHPLLNDAAVQAVRQWEYRPAMFNGQPIEIITTVTVNFVLP